MNTRTHEDGEDDYTRVEMSFNSRMTEFFEGSDISYLVERMLADIKTQVKNSRMTEGGFSLDKTMGLSIKFDPPPGSKDIKKIWLMKVMFQVG